MIIPSKHSGYQAGIRLYPGGLLGFGGGGGGGVAGDLAPPPPPPPPWANLGVNTERGYNTLMSTPGQPMSQNAIAYNDLLGQGFNNQQIRSSAETAIGKQGDEYWNQMVQAAGLQSHTGRPMTGSAQFFQPIQKQQYTNYATANPMGVSQYGRPMPLSGGMGGGNTLTPEIARNLMQRSMMGGVPTSEFAKYGGYDSVQSLYEASGGNYAKPTHVSTQPMQFNPYTNSYGYSAGMPQMQSPFSYQQPALPNYGPSQAFVGRSSQMRGTPNVMRRAEGGIASLLDDSE
jgi:hypothetical protein